MPPRTTWFPDEIIARTRQKKYIKVAALFFLLLHPYNMCVYLHYELCMCIYIYNYIYIYTHIYMGGSQNDGTPKNHPKLDDLSIGTYGLGEPPF